MRSAPPVRRRTGRLTWTLVLLATLVVALALALLVTGRFSGPSSPPASSTPLAARATTNDPASFQDTYVEDGRVVRADQGGDTVSEGQAYGMLIALGAGDRARFAAIWRWTRDHLQRDDGLVSWRWDGDRVADPSSASDADLDMARALVLAGRAFDAPSYTSAGKRLGAAVLDHETVRTPAGLVLVAGQWATTAPYAFNPSYVSPVATTVLSRATKDPRWAELERGSRAALLTLTADGRLPPDWAELSADGSTRAVPGPAGAPVQYGYDAARTLVRQAESCDATDRRIAASASELVSRDGRRSVSVYDLAGSPQTDVSSPLVSMGQAAGLAAAGEPTEAVAAIRTAGQEQQQAPTYYGDAWTVLAPMLLTDPDLGGCPLLGRS